MGRRRSCLYIYLLFHPMDLLVVVLSLEKLALVERVQCFSFASQKEPGQVGRQAFNLTDPYAILQSSHSAVHLCAQIS